MRAALPAPLEDVIAQYHLPLQHFEAMLDAMQMDVSGHMLWPDTATLSRYCGGVAGAVGLLAARIMGASDASADFALALGQVLQRINILRDITEDAARGRIYVPRADERSASDYPTPEQVLRDDSIIQAQRQQFIDDIKARITQLTVPSHDKLALLPAFAMLGVYLAVFERIIAQMKSNQAALRICKYRAMPKA
jgi:phytoene/squalene synthetase